MAEKVKEVSFKSTTRTVNLLGRDNVLDYRSAILELVKNSYDAFSNQVNIRIIGKDVIINEEKDKRATSIEIIDYGQGMSLDKIINVFFTLGTDDKTYTTSIKHLDSERVMNGSMGIGRLSLGRLGNISSVITSDGIEAYRFSINWNNFITGEDLDTVKVDIEQLSLSEFTSEYTNRGLENPKCSGTILIANELKDEWLLSDKGQSGTNYSLLKLTLNKLKNPLKLEKSGEFKIILDYFEEEGEAAFYGPKIDFMATDTIGREHQVATVQLDFVQPERFELEYINQESLPERPVMIHCALLGSVERFMSVFIEHTAGWFPFWSAPEQIRILTINDTVADYVKKITDLLESNVLMKPVRYNEFRFSVDNRNESLGKKIREATTKKIPVQIIVGPKDQANNEVSVRTREKEEKVKLDSLIDYLSQVK